jgi:hypothetical protein
MKSIDASQKRIMPIEHATESDSSNQEEEAEGMRDSLANKSAKW